MSDKTLSWKLSGEAREFIQDWDSRVLAIKGPVGSAKTSLCLLKIWLTFNHMQPSSDGKKRQRWLIVRKTLRTLKNTTLVTWNNWYASLGVMKGDPPIYSYQDGEYELEVIFAGLDDKKAIDKIKSSEYTGAYVNELNEITNPLLFKTIGERTGRYPSGPVGGGGLGRSFVLADLNTAGHRSWIPSEFATTRGWRLINYPPAIIQVGAEVNAPRDQYAIDRAGNKWITNEDTCYRQYAQFARYWLDLAENAERNYINTQLVSNWDNQISGVPVHEAYVDNYHYPSIDLSYNPKLPIGLGFDLGNTPACTVVQRQTDGTLFVLDEIASEHDFLQPFLEDRVIPVLDKKYKNWRDNHESRHDPADMGAVAHKNYSAAAIFKRNGIKSSPAKSNLLDFRRSCLHHFLSKIVRGHPYFLLSRDCHLLREGLGGQFHYEHVSTTQHDPKPLIKEVPKKNFHSHICESLEYAASIYVEEIYTRTKEEGVTDFSEYLRRKSYQRWP